MKRAGNFIISTLAVFLVLIVVNLGILIFMIWKTDGMEDLIQMEHVSDGIVASKGGDSTPNEVQPASKGGDSTPNEVQPVSYQMEDTVKTELDAKEAFVILINENGDVIWTYKKPEEVPTHYQMSDVASFSRWYLCDYPVFTWCRDDGILVLGLPKDSLWKYSLEFRMKTIQGIIAIFPYWLLANVAVLMILPFWITRRWSWKREKQRTEWIAGVSHDIRTPLSILLGNAVPGSMEEKQCLRIRELIGNLNTDNKLVSGTGKWNEENIRLASLLREIVVDYMNTYEDQYPMNLEVDPELKDYQIKADAGLIRRMIENILTNAIRHNENGCEITVRLEKSAGKGLVLAISDNGVGTDEQKIRELNKKIRNNYLPEHGLGLRVVKQIARKYHYKVNFASEDGFQVEIRM